MVTLALSGGGSDGRSDGGDGREATVGVVGVRDVGFERMALSLVAFVLGRFGGVVRQRRGGGVDGGGG